MRRLIRGGRLVTEIDSYEADVLIEDGRIVAVGRDMAAPADSEIYDASGKLVLPGAIDSHVHVSLDLKGHVSSDFRATSREAALGGVTTMLSYATPQMGQTLEEAVEERIEQAEGESYVDFGLHAALVNWDDREDDEIPRMIDAGVPSFKAYTVYSSSGLKSDEDQIYSALLNVGKHGGLLE
ncbi:MAG: dihydropyrimidinase, partial [Candidatus Eisenbacteria bacterium]|nr:dihydropyrimidinase [Candidatus Eisenbacteria bacterium]